jgi:hypothetical protein
VLDAGGNVTLNNAANDFVGGVTVVKGQAVALTDVNSLSVGGTSASLEATASSGDLTIVGYAVTNSVAATAAAPGTAIRITGGLVAGTNATLTADVIGVQATVDAGTNGVVVMQPVSNTGTFWISGVYTNIGVNYSGLNSVHAGTLQVGNDSTFAGNIVIARDIKLTTRSSSPFLPTPVATATNDVTALTLQTTAGTITNALAGGAWAVINVPRLSLVATNAAILGSLANSSDVSFLAWRCSNPIRFVDLNLLDLLWSDPSKIGKNVPPVDDHLNTDGTYLGIGGVYGPFPVTGNDILFNGGGLPAQQFANALAPFNSVELPMTRLTISGVSAEFDAKEYAERIRRLVGPGSIFRSFAEIPFERQVPLEEVVKPENASKWVRGYLGISGSTGAPQQSAY